MSLYLIGDLQGCDAPLKRLLDEIDFSPSTDTLYLLGDLVNRGPDSLGVLRRLSALGSAAQCLLGRTTDEFALIQFACEQAQKPGH